MKKISILLIILLVLIIGGIVSGIVISQYRKVPDKSDYTNFCGIDDLKSCINGKCSCEGACYDVVDNVDAPNCITNPNVPCSYSYKDPKTNENKYIPSGKWCLPKPIKSLQCNPYTGTPTLSKRNDGELVWNCECNADVSEILEKKGEFGDCNLEKCNIVDIDDNTNRWYTNCYNPDGTPKDNFNTCWDPAEGKCLCPSGMMNPYINKGDVNNFKCVSDSCYDIDLYPGSHGTNSSYSSCKCPTIQPYKGDANGVYRTLVSCPDNQDNNSSCSVDPNANEENKYNSCDCGRQTTFPGRVMLGSQDEVDLSEPQCIPDPCNPGGYFDKVTRECVCHGDTIQQQSYSSPVGMICADMKSNDICSVRGKGCICCQGQKILGDFTKGSNVIKNIKQDISNLDNTAIIVPYDTRLFTKGQINILKLDSKKKTITLSDKDTALISSKQSVIGIPSDSCQDKECPICPECSEFKSPDMCNSASGCTYTTDENNKNVCAGNLQAIVKCKDCKYKPYPGLGKDFNLQDYYGLCLGQGTEPRPTKPPTKPPTTKPKNK